MPLFLLKSDLKVISFIQNTINYPEYNFFKNGRDALLKASLFFNSCKNIRDPQLKTSLSGIILTKSWIKSLIFNFSFPKRKKIKNT